MSTVIKKLRQCSFQPTDNRRLAELCGQFNEHLHLLERHFDVEINVRGNQFHIIGEPHSTRNVSNILNHLYELTQHHNSLNLAKVKLTLQKDFSKQTIDSYLEEQKYQIHTKFTRVMSQGLSQTLYLKNIQNHEINFGVGPAGTGKTYLAVASAIEALEKDRVHRILLVRPAVEAGERLGFLPGDLSQKVDPYLRPLYDALYEMLGCEKVVKLIERNVIEIAPLAYMRGRTLNDSFIILDESQNTTKEQMKMFLTRIGFGSVCVITGDVTQIDLPKNVQSGLCHAIEVLKNITDISFTFFKAKDVVRHPLVQKIVTAYDKYENRGE